jgi:hypothetical protein
LRFKVSGSGFEGFGFRVWGLNIRVLGVIVRGSGFGALWHLEFEICCGCLQ